jgi:hypothetical protein
MESPHIARRDVLIGAGLLVATPALAAPRLVGVLELRQYTCRGGQRDTLIGLFEEQFIAPQDALGAQVLGIFRDADDPDRFVWLRGFETIAVRGQALPAFYGGPAWKAHREAANATMLDSDNVLLLRPTVRGPFPSGRHDGDVLVGIHYLEQSLIAPFGRFFDTRMRPGLAAAGADVIATCASETAANNFPALPIREKDRVFVWLARTPRGGASLALRRWRSASGWRDGADEALLPALMRKPEILRLHPTAKSPLA